MFRETQWLVFLAACAFASAATVPETPEAPLELRAELTDAHRQTRQCNHHSDCSCQSGAPICYNNWCYCIYAHTKPLACSHQQECPMHFCSGGVTICYAGHCLCFTDTLEDILQLNAALNVTTDGDILPVTEKESSNISLE